MRQPPQRCAAAVAAPPPSTAAPLPAAAPCSTCRSDFLQAKLEVVQLPGMESALVLGSRDQQLGISFKKLFLSDSDVCLKVRGQHALIH